MTSHVRVLFVCMGNICRSPIAHGLFRHLVAESGLQERIAIDSAGTHAYHVGNPPDERTQDTAQRRGIDISDQRARHVNAADFEHFDYVLAMDRDNYAILTRLCPPGHEDKLHLFMDFAEGLSETEVPDPYYGGMGGFEHVFDLVEVAARGLLERIKAEHL